MKKLIFAILLMYGLDLVAQSQSIERLQPFVGTWKGGGWYMDRTGTRYEFTQTETVTIELAGTALVIRGKGMSNGKPVHDALAVIQYDSINNTYPFFAFLPDGKNTQTLLKVLGDGRYEWGINLESGEIKYSIEISEGEWKEAGAFSPNGQNWYPFIDFTVTKVD